MLKAEEFARILREATKAVSIENETIEGELNLTGIDIPAGVSLRNCIFERTVTLSMSQVAGSLDLTGNTFKAGLSLEATRIGHHLVLDGCTFYPSHNQWCLNTQWLEVKGNLKINNARLFASWSGQEMWLQGSLVAEGLTMEGDPPPSVALDGLRAGGQVELSRASLGETSLSLASIGLRLYLSSTRFAGEARFLGAHIGGQANFKGVSFKEVAFDGAEVKGDLFFQPFIQQDGKAIPCEIGGEARFHGAHIGGQANFKGVSFKGGVAFDRAEIKGSLFFQPFIQQDGKAIPCEIGGEARFHGAHIGGQANFKGVSFKEVVLQGTSIEAETFLYNSVFKNLNAEGAHFGKSLDFEGAKIKALSLKNARIYDLRLEGMKEIGRLELMGCEYSSVDDVRKLCGLLEEKGGGKRPPYEFLENYCRKIGEDSFAREVYYNWCERHYERSKREASSWWKSVLWSCWDLSLRHGVGYGVRPHYLLRAVAILFVIGCLMFKWHWVIEPVGKTIGPTPSWPLSAWFSLETLLPWSLDYLGEYDWQLTLLGAFASNILRALTWFVVTVGLMAIGGLFRRYE